MQGYAAPPLSVLVTPSWLLARLRHKPPSVTIIDTSWYMPSSNENGYEQFKGCHIPSARYFNIDGSEARDTNTALPHMLPPSRKLNKMSRELGLRKGTPAVLYTNKSPAFCASARVWWMLRALGKEDVYILNGGLSSWIEDGYDTETGAGDLKEGEEVLNDDSKDLVWGLNDILQRDQVDDLVIDARSEGRFKGIDPEPRKELSSGHMPGSVNVPSGCLINAENGKLKSHDELVSALKDRGFVLDDLKKKSNVVTSCGSGVTAAIVALALHEVGVKNAAVYDGSWVEYASSAQNPVVR